MKTIYFIEAKAFGLVKVGCSVLPRRRLLMMAAWSPVELSLLCTAPGAFHDEWKIHKRLCAFRSHGEWFHRCPALDELIAHVTRAGRLPSGWRATKTEARARHKGRAFDVQPVAGTA